MNHPPKRSNSYIEHPSERTRLVHVTVYLGRHSWESRLDQKKKKNTIALIKLGNMNKYSFLCDFCIFTGRNSHRRCNSKPVIFTKTENRSVTEMRMLFWNWVFIFVVTRVQYKLVPKTVTSVSLELVTDMIKVALRKSWFHHGEILLLYSSTKRLITFFFFHIFLCLRSKFFSQRIYSKHPREMCCLRFTKQCGNFWSFAS